MNVMLVVDFFLFRHSHFIIIITETGTHIYASDSAQARELLVVFISRFLFDISERVKLVVLIK